jgi:hypothetical protein
MINPTTFNEELFIKSKNEKVKLYKNENPDASN